MRAAVVVVGRVSAKYSFKVSSSEDEHPVEALDAYRPHPTLGHRVSLGRPYRGLDHRHILAVPDRIEGAAVLRIAVVDENLGVRKAFFHHGVPGLLGDPGGVGVGGDTSDVNPTGGELDKEKDVEGL